MVVMLMCALGPVPHVARRRKTNSYTNKLQMGKLQRAITLIVRCESKICLVKSLISTHSACPCKNCPSKYSQIPHEFLLPYSFFQAAYTTKVGNDRHVDVRARPHPSRSAWAENIANAWLPIQTYGITGCIVYSYNKHTSILTRVGNGHQVGMRAWPRPSRSA